MEYYFLVQPKININPKSSLMDSSTEESKAPWE